MCTEIFVVDFWVLLVRGSGEHHKLYQKGAYWGQMSVSDISPAPTKAVSRDKDIESLWSAQTYY